MNFFDSRIFLIYRSVPQRKFSALWDKKLSTERRDIPFFWIGFFDTWHLKLSETLDGSSRSFSILWDKKIEGKPWYAKKFPRSQTFWILENVPRKFLRTVRQKNSNEDCDSPFSCIESFDNRKVLEGWRRYPRIFSVLWGQKNQRRIAIPPTEHKSFRCPKDSETKRDSLPRFLSSMRENNSTEKSDITLLGMKFFDTRTIVIYRSVPQRNLSALWAKKFSTENRDIPFSFKILFNTSHLKLFETLVGSSRSFSLLWDKKIEGKPWYAKKFPRSQTFWILENVPRKFLRTVRQKNSNEDCDSPFSCIESFDNRKVLEGWRRYPRIFSVLWGQKNQRRIEIPPYWA